MRNKWGIRYGKFWAVQWRLDGCVGIGVSISPYTGVDRYEREFGPYIDLHLLCFIFSFGFNPAYSSDMERMISVSRGGLSD